MKKFSTLLIAIICFTTTISAQNSVINSDEQVKQLYNQYINEAVSFTADLKEMPENFSPKSLNDYLQFQGENADEKLQKLRNSYTSIINYFSEYSDTNGENLLSYLFQKHVESAKEGPSCFAPWYANELEISSAAVTCCSSDQICNECIDKHLLQSMQNISIYTNCLNQYK